MTRRAIGTITTMQSNGDTEYTENMDFILPFFTTFYENDLPQFYCNTLVAVLMSAVDVDADFAASFHLLLESYLREFQMRSRQMDSKCPAT